MTDSPTKDTWNVGREGSQKKVDGQGKPQQRLGKEPHSSILRVGFKEVCREPSHNPRWRSDTSSREGDGKD